MCGIDDVSQCITPVYLSNEFLRKLLCTHPRLCVHNGISHSTHGVCNPFIPPRRMARCVLQRQWISHLHDLHPRRLRLQLRRLLLTTPVPSSDATLRRSSTRASSRALSNVSHARRVSALATISVTCVWSACLRARAGPALSLPTKCTNIFPPCPPPSPADATSDGCYHIVYEDGDEEDLESGEVASLARSACTPLDSSQRGKDLIGCSLWAPPSKEGAGFVYVRVGDYDGLQYLVEYLHKDVADGVLGNETWDDADFRGCLIFPGGGDNSDKCKEVGCCA